MDNIFNINRFEKYFVYDLKNLWNRFGLNIIIIGLFPVILYLVCGITSSITLHGWQTLEFPGRLALSWVPFLILTIAFGAKTYGHLTKKMSGTQWLLVPASRLEKFISMILIAIVVAPAAFMAVFFLSDGLLSLIDPNYGEALITANINEFIADETDGVLFFPARGFWILWTAMITNIVAFLLGALCFKKGKVGKTILVLMLLGMVFSWISIGVTRMMVDMDPEQLEMLKEWAKSVIANAEFNLNLLYWISFIIEAGGCGVAIWFRLKTLKH